jgi:hypothetical protein
VDFGFYFYDFTVARALFSSRLSLCFSSSSVFCPVVGALLHFAGVVKVAGGERDSKRERERERERDAKLPPPSRGRRGHIFVFVRAMNVNPPLFSQASVRTGTALLEQKCIVYFLSAAHRSARRRYYVLRREPFRSRLLHHPEIIAICHVLGAQSRGGFLPCTFLHATAPPAKVTFLSPNFLLRSSKDRDTEKFTGELRRMLRRRADADVQKGARVGP